jgi:hypothetical protein
MRKGPGSVSHESRVRDVNFPKVKPAGKIAGGIVAKKTARTGGVRPNTGNPGPAGYETGTPLGARTVVGRRLSKLARR